MRRLVTLFPALCLSVLLAHDASAAPDNGACCVQSTSRLDALVNPTKGSDEKFFTAAGGAPNVLFIVDTSGSMKSWPEDFPSSRGCNHPSFSGNGFDPSVDYRGMITGMTGPPGSKVATMHPNWFNKEIVYRPTGDGSGDGSEKQGFRRDFSNSGTPQGTKYTGTGGTPAARLDSAKVNGCNAITANATYRTECKQCLDTRGYYVLNSTTRLGTGNFFTFYAPRDVAAVMALSHLLFDVREVRLGIMTFGNWGSGSTPCWTNNGDYPVCLWQEMGPSCDKSYPLDTSAVENNRNSILNALAKNNDFDTNTPLASQLYAAAHYLRSSAGPPAQDAFTALLGAGFPTRSNFNEKATDKSICNECSFNAVVLLTDGEPYNDNAISSWPSAITSLTTATAATCPAGTGRCDNYLDEVAAFMWQNDLRLDYPGTQRVATYTIGFGTNANANQLLASASKVGGGKAYTAKSLAQLKQVILDILDDIQSRNNSFASASVASVQTGSTSLPAVLPRMLPKKGQPWEGRLWRFEQFNEFVEGADKNGDGDQADIFLIDKTPAAPTSPANIVVEDSDGNFVLQSSGTPAQKWWEANERLVSALSAVGDYNTKRNLWTVLDTNGDGAFTHADTLVAFKVGTAAEDAKLGEYLGIIGTDFCPVVGGANGRLINRLGITPAALASLVGVTLSGTPTQAEYDRACIRALVRHVQGMDLLDVDADGDRTEPRASVLGDIFHSSPVMVEPPVDPFLCNLGLSNQCARTLFSDTLGVAHTPLQATTVSSCSPAVTRPGTAYDSWANAQAERDKVILVGANDGMVHAFEDSRVVTPGACTGGRPSPTWQPAATSGRELWAFIPPDQLPRLQEQVFGHAYAVDGDIMVRDVWADDSTSPDGIKQANEFHTLAIVSEGRGGTHYFALELAYDSNGAAKDRPNFRWMFPQPCSEEVATFGKSFYALSPKPPPVGPVLIDKSTLPPSNPLSLATGYPRKGVTETHERWVVALSGGWSPGLERGRGVYLVDAWEGSINGRRDNLWWKLEYDPSASSDELEPAREMTHSVPAPVAMVDYGDNGAPSQDGFFDTAIWGDTAGQVWLARLHAPGRYDGTLGRINNWSGARAFEADRDGAPSVKNKNPFFYLPSVAIEPGTNKLRVFIGSGNRYSVLEENAGTCRFDNPVACAKAGCDQVNVRYKVSTPVLDSNQQHTHWSGGNFQHAKYDGTPKADSLCGAPGSVAVTATFTDNKVGACPQTSGPAVTPGDLHTEDYECGLNAAGTSFTCRAVVPEPANFNDLFPNDKTITTGLGNNRFYGFWAYGSGRHFSESPDGGVTPKNFDALRLSDRSGVNPVSGDLVNVTSVGCSASGACDGGATVNDYGWFLDYGQLKNKTATGSAVLASCVLWSDLSPTGGDGGVCTSRPQPLSGLYQADFITGQPNCAAGFLPPDGGAYARSVTRTVVAPPPEPAAVVQVSKAGQVKYSAMIVEPGKGQATTADVSGGQDVLQLVYQLPVSRTLHDCRHADGGCVVVP
jgi:type IV pilus assembly protein PilY1